ncbi:putative VWFA domain-containing protein [Seiridium unicorne]|uniref:VWFA domain-containing protein n=1 Tax=Seiridium unicorne TaxID=138068 RepID=A0ABR2UQK6_9PEZI
MCFGGRPQRKSPGLFDTRNEQHATRRIPLNPTTERSIRQSNRRLAGTAAAAVHRHLYMNPAQTSRQDSSLPIFESMRRKPVPSQTQPTEPGITEQEDQFAFLAHFDTCFLIDDSKAMKRYWDEVIDLIRAVVPLCADRDTTGIDIYFGNHQPAGSLLLGIGRQGYRNIGLVTGMPDMHDNVEGIFNGVQPTGRHRITDRLRLLLEDYMLSYHRSVQETGSTVKPKNIIVVTAQRLSQRVTHAVHRTAKQLDDLDAPSYQLGIQFFQIGDDEEARKDMQFLDDKLPVQQGVRDIVDTATWTDGPGKLSADGVLKVVGGAVRRSIDLIQLEELRMPPLPAITW